MDLLETRPLVVEVSNIDHKTREMGPATAKAILVQLKDEAGPDRPVHVVDSKFEPWYEFAGTFFPSVHDSVAV